MNLGLQDKVAVITGASKGIGKAIALAFAKEGSKVAISARGKEELGLAAKAIKEAANGDILSFAGDMSVKSEIDMFFRQIIDKWGTIHILVNNVGSAKKIPFEELQEEDWDSVFSMNLFSAIYCSSQALPYMKNQKWGRIINIGAISAKQPGFGLMASNVSKSALLSFSKTLSSEVAGHGVLVNCLCPGRILSEQTMGYHTAEEREAIARAHIPIGRFGDPEEVANLAVFLGSECASYITGATLPVDGGFSKGLY